MIDGAFIVKTNEMLKNLMTLRTYLDSVHHNPEFATVFNKPIISFMQHACDFILENLQREFRNYKDRKGLS